MIYTCDPLELAKCATTTCNHDVEHSDKMEGPFTPAPAGTPLKRFIRVPGAMLDTSVAIRDAENPSANELIVSGSADTGDPGP